MRGVVRPQSRKGGPAVFNDDAEPLIAKDFSLGRAGSMRVRADCAQGHTTTPSLDSVRYHRSRSDPVDMTNLIE